MSAFRVLDSADHRIDEIFVYTRDRWGDAQARAYIEGLFAHFEAIAARRAPWREIPAEFGVAGYFSRYEKHFVYWKVLSDGAVGIVTVLHQRMHVMERLREDER
jgi:toxin ParE1/3/4